jgi:hypothetical protein
VTTTVWLLAQWVQRRALLMEWSVIEMGKMLGQTVLKKALMKDKKMVKLE